MTKLRHQFNFTNLDDVDELSRYLNLFSSEITGVVGGELEFDVNLRSSTVDVSFTTANQQLQIKHTLDKVPTGYILAGSDVATRIYNGTNGTKDWTDTNIYLKSDTIAKVKLIIF